MDEMIIALDKALRTQKITYVVIGGRAAHMKSSAKVLSEETGKKEILENLLTVLALLFLLFR